MQSSGESSAGNPVGTTITSCAFGERENAVLFVMACDVWNC